MAGEKLWGQVRKVHINKILFDYENIDVEFEINFTGDNTSDVAQISIYNLSESTRDKIKKGDPVVIQCGYKDYFGTVFTGVVDNMTTEPDGVDLATRIVATPSNGIYLNTIINTQFAVNTTPRDILETLSRNTTFKIDIQGLPLNNPYKAGKCFSSPLNKVIDVLGKDTRAKVEFKDQRIIFSDPSQKYKKVKLLNETSGLISVHKKPGTKTDPKEYYIVECLPIFDLTTGTVFKIESSFIKNKNTMKIKELIIYAQGTSDFKMLITAEVVE